MFTGLILETGAVRSLEVTGARRRLIVRAPALARDIRVGDSLAVNGCCLTVSAHTAEELSFDLLEETVARTNLARLQVGDAVNLERALAAGSSIGGHFVQGHVDCTTQIISYQEVNGDYRLEAALPRQGSRYLAEKGSIALNGISLTVTEIKDNSFVVWIIPHTREVTNLREAGPGTLVNLEFDLLAKYVERMLTSPSRDNHICSNRPRAGSDEKTAGR